MGLADEDIVVTTGSQQALYLIGDVLIDPGDIVIAANPSYFVYSGTLTSLGAKVVTVPMDDDGMDVDAVARALERIDRAGQLDRVKFVYCTSYYQNPTGLTLSAERRPRLLEIVKRFSRRQRILILEDAAYRELGYDGDALRSIKSYDPDNRYTVISQTFSKPFAPGLKLGYTAMPADLMHAVLQQKGNHDFGSANLCQHIAWESLRDGSYEKHVGVLQQAYRIKRDLLLEALERELGSGAVGRLGSGEVHPAGERSTTLPPHRPTASGEPGSGEVRPSGEAPTTLPPHRPTAPLSSVTWTRPHGGLYSWLTLPESVDTSRGGAMFQACIEAGVLYVPGDYCFQPDEAGRVPRNHLRLSFGQVHADQIGPGVERLAAVVRQQLSQIPSPRNSGDQADEPNDPPHPTDGAADSRTNRTNHSNAPAAGIG